MTTAYEVRLQVAPQSSARSLKDVLQQALADTGEFERSPQIDQLPEDDPALLVTLWIDSADTSTAQQEARAAIGKALVAAGLDEDAAKIRDAQVVQPGG